MPTSLTSCKNCEELFNKNFKFCPHCGQQSNEKLTVGLLFSNTIKNYFSVDARFFKSFFPLLFRPGYLATKFIEGKRLKYLHPAQLYLFISLVFFFLLSTTVVVKQVEAIDKELEKTQGGFFGSNDEQEQGLDSIQIDSLLIKPLKDNILIDFEVKGEEQLDSLITENIDKVKKSRDSYKGREYIIDSLIARNASDSEIHKALGMQDDANYFERKFYEQTLKIYKQRNGSQVLQSVYDTIPIALFILLPIFAFILKMLFYKHGTYAYHLVFSFYFYAFLFTAFSILLLTNQIFDIPRWLDVLVILSTFFYLCIAIKNFYKQKGWFVCFLKTSVVTTVYFVFVIPIALVIIGVFSFLFY